MQEPSRLPLKLSIDEAVLLLVGLKLLDEMVETIEINGLPQSELMNGLIHKLNGILPPEMAAMSDEIVDDIVMANIDPLEAATADSSYALPMYAIDKVMPVLEQAIVERNSVEINYYSMSREEFTERLVDPYGLRRDGDLVWMVAYCHMREDTRVFRVDRIKDCLPSDQAFDLPADFDPANFFDDDEQDSNSSEP